MDKKIWIKDEIDDLKRERILSFKQFQKQLKKIERQKDRQLDFLDSKIISAQREKRKLDRQSHQ